MSDGMKTPPERRVVTVHDGPQHCPIKHSFAADVPVSVEYHYPD